MKVNINQKKCIQCNLCGDVSENLINAEHGIAKLSPGTDLSDQNVLARIKLAAEVCPQLAIEIVET